MDYIVFLMSLSLSSIFVLLLLLLLKLRRKKDENVDDSFVMIKKSHFLDTTA